MNQHYPTLLAIHISCIMASGGLFLLRYVLATLNVNWRKSFALRIMPHVVDTGLLASAIMLCIAIKQYPFVNHWLTVKVIALIVYIGLGMLALKAKSSATVRRTSFLLAATVFLFIVSVARSQLPWGVLNRFFQ